MRSRSRLSRFRALLLASALLAGCGGRSSLSVLDSDAPFEPPRVCLPASDSDTWSLGLGSGVYDYPKIARIDINGDIVVAAVFQGTIDFGCETFSTVGDAPDLLLARLDPRGRLLWAHHLEQAGYIPHDLGMDLDGSGHIVLTGSGSGAPSSFGGTTLAEGIFLASFDPSGKLRWAHDITGAQAAQNHDWSLGVSAKGRILLSGGLHGTIDIGLGPIVGSGSSDESVAVAAGWDEDGIPTFDRSLPFDITSSVTFAGDGSALLVGVAGTGPFSGPRYPVVAKLAADGAFLWKQGPPADYIALRPGAVDASGDVVIAGISSTQSNALVVSSLSGVDGHALWSRSIDGSLAACVLGGIVPLPGGRILSAGGTKGFADPIEAPVTESGSGSACIATLDAPGEGGHVRRFGDDGQEWFVSVALDPTGHPIVIGRTEANLNLGVSGVVASPCAPDILCYENFLARLSP